MQIKIYQTETKKLMFMPYDMVSKDKNLLKADNYKMVFSEEFLDCHDASNTNDEHELLEKLFKRYNEDDRPNGQVCRSLSMSDILSLDGRLYYCDTFGFKKLELPGLT